MCIITIQLVFIYVLELTMMQYKFKFILTFFYRFPCWINQKIPFHFKSRSNLIKKIKAWRVRKKCNSDKYMPVLLIYSMCDLKELNISLKYINIALTRMSLCKFFVCCEVLRIQEHVVQWRVLRWCSIRNCTVSKA